MPGLIAMQCCASAVYAFTGVHLSSVPQVYKSSGWLNVGSHKQRCTID